MKKIAVALAAVVLILGISTAAPAATITTGSWDLSTGIWNGMWVEFWADGGGAGSVGSELNAWSQCLGPGTFQWSFTGALLQNVTPLGGTPAQYETTYTGGSLWLKNDPLRWGDSITIAGMTATNTSYHDVGGNLVFALTAQGTSGDYAYDIRATYHGPEFFIDEWCGEERPGHCGIGFDTVELTISHVPIANAFWLLGTGLIGLVGIRRRLGMA